MSKGEYLGQPVVIKQLKSIPNDEPTQKNFAREAHISHVASSAHLKAGHQANLVRFYGACASPPHWCLVYDYMDDGSAEKMLIFEQSFASGQPSDVSAVLQMAVDAARGLSYLHSKKIVHRDVACRNLLIFDKKRVW